MVYAFHASNFAISLVSQVVEVGTKSSSKIIIDSEGPVGKKKSVSVSVNVGCLQCTIKQ